MLVPPKNGYYFGDIFLAKHIFEKIFKKKYGTETKPTTLRMTSANPCLFLSHFKGIIDTVIRGRGISRHIRVTLS